MNLLDIRQKFVELSGRYDLVIDVASYADNGADFFIKAGQRWLDRELSFPAMRGELSVSISTGDVSANLPNVRSVEQVFIEDSVEDSMYYLEKLSLRELREAYGADYGALADVEQAAPQAYALGMLRGGTSSATTESQKMLVFVLPADRGYTLKVQVLMDSVSLSNDSSESYWSIEHPDLLVQAALYKMEQFYRNREGASAFYQSLRQALEQIDNEVVEQEMSEASRLKNSWRFIDEPLGRLNRLTS